LKISLQWLYREKGEVTESRGVSIRSSQNEDGPDMLLGGSMENKLIVAHRGASLDSPGNTMAAYRRAIELGADMIELDVRRTKNARLIAYHDADISGKRIDSLTLGEIRELSRGLEIPTLEEVFELAKKRIRLDVELKDENHEEEVVDLALKHMSLEEFMITSFNDHSLRVVKERYPEVTVGLILGKERPKNVVGTRLSELFPMRRCRRAKADILIPHWKLIRFGFLRRAKKHRKSVIVWTVNERAMLFKFLENDGIDGIMTDVPDLALTLRNEIQSGHGSAAMPPMTT